MGSLGETLRQARLDRGASLVDAEDETHIRRKYLEALEAEDYASLPALVYTRGFIRNYARYLGLDPERTLDLYLPGRWREERPVLRPATPQMSIARPISMQVFLVATGLVLAGLLLAYLWAQYNSFVESLSQSDQSAVARAVVATPTRPIVAGSPSPAAAGPSPAPAAPAPPAQPAGPAPTPERGVVVEATITDRTWMEVWVDGVSQLQSTLQAGANRRFTANQSIRMRVGNAGGVEVTVNDERRGTLGERHQVKEFVWER